MAAERVLPAELAAQAEQIAAALQLQAERHTATGETPQIRLDEAVFTRVVDPASQLPGYEGIWRNARKERCGSLAFNSDGSFYAEYDLFCTHPGDPRWFVEMVIAWGRADKLNCEAKRVRIS